MYAKKYNKCQSNIFNTKLLGPKVQWQTASFKDSERAGVQMASNF